MWCNRVYGCYVPYLQLTSKLQLQYIENELWSLTETEDCHSFGHVWFWFVCPTNSFSSNYKKKLEMVRQQFNVCWNSLSLIHVYALHFKRAFWRKRECFGHYRYLWFRLATADTGEKSSWLFYSIWEPPITDWHNMLNKSKPQIQPVST